MELSTPEPRPPKKSNKLLMVGAVVAVLIIVAAVVVVALAGNNNNNGTKVIYWTAVAPANQKAQIDAGLIDGGVSWEPYVSDSLVAGSADVVVWSGDVWPHHPCCVVAVKSSLLQSNPDLVARLVRAHIDANLWIADTLEHPESANYTALLNMGAEFAVRSTAVVEASLDHIEFGYNITNAIKTGLVDFTNMFINLDQTTNQTLHDRGYATVTDFINAFTNSSVVTAAMNVQPSEVSVGTIKLGYLSGDLHQFARVVAMNASLFGGKTLFEKYGVAVTSVGPYANGGAVMDAFATGAIDAGYLGAPPAILKRLNVNTDITVVALANMEGSAIIAKKGITTLAGLDNKTVATPGAASIQHLLLLVYAQQNGYTVKLKGT